MIPRRETWVAALFMAAIGAGTAVADDDEVTGAAKRFLPYAKATAVKYQLKNENDEPLKMEKAGESLLRWTNPLTVSKNHGELFLWTDRGRPTAVLSMYEYSTDTGNVHEHHEWISLALGPFRATGPREWSPITAGIELRHVPDAPTPADTPIRRLGQIRELAVEFTAEKTSRQGIKRPIRLMVQPLFRYDTGDPDVIDGALYTFVEGTDPDVFLCLEARLFEGKPAWYYGLTRVVRLRLAVSHKGREIWVGELLDPSQTHNQKYATYSVFDIR